MEFRIPSQPGVYTQVPTAEQPVHQQPTGQPGHTVFVHTTQYTPVPAQRRELWFSSSMFGNNYAIEQPDPGRIVLSGSRSKYTGMVRYTYADQLPCMIQASIVCTVIFGILASPVTLLCCIPLILSMKTVSGLIMGCWYYESVGI